MRGTFVLCLAAFAGLAACGSREPVADVVISEVEPECKTVTVFSDTKISQPKETLPQEWRQFSGVWGKAGWDGYWCHDLYVMAIEEDGKVKLMDAHGPGGRHDGTVFSRVGRIDEGNRLTFVADGIRREYWIENGKLRGIRHLRGDDKMVIAMHRKS
jgi:hypothetical protein